MKIYFNFTRVVLKPKQLLQFRRVKLWLVVCLSLSYKSLTFFPLFRESTIPRQWEMVNKMCTHWRNGSHIQTPFKKSELSNPSFWRNSLSCIWENWAARATHVFTVEKNTVIIKINSRFYLYYKIKILIIWFLKYIKIYIK